MPQKVYVYSETALVVDGVGLALQHGFRGQGTGFNCGRELTSPRQDLRTGGNEVIRQAISCDICGAEKKQTNHWFVAYDQGGELRVCGFSPGTRLRAGSKHLCGQACLHKMIDEFISITLAGRVPSPAANTAETVEHSIPTDVSLTSKSAYRGFDAAQQPMLQPAPVLSQRITPSIPAVVVAMQPRVIPEQPRAFAAQPAMAETPNYTSRHWRAEAWERERERELHSVERRQDNASRHRKSS